MSPCPCAKIKVVCSDMLDRFLSSGIAIDYDVTTKMLRNHADAAHDETADSGQSPTNEMRKQGSLIIRSVDLMAGAMVMCAMSSLAMIICKVKRLMC